MGVRYHCDSCGRVVDLVDSLLLSPSLNWSRRLQLGGSNLNFCDLKCMAAWSNEKAKELEAESNVTELRRLKD